MCGCVNHTRFYGGDRIRRFKLGSLVLPRCVRLRCDEGRCVVRIDVLHSLHRLSIAQWLPDREDRLLCLSLLFAGDRDRHLVAVNGSGAAADWIHQRVHRKRVGIPLQCHLHTHSSHITLLREITRKKMERKRKEREVELKEKKTS